jgi:hypothetical protein
VNFVAEINSILAWGSEGIWLWDIDTPMHPKLIIRLRYLGGIARIPERNAILSWGPGFPAEHQASMLLWNLDGALRFKFSPEFGGVRHALWAQELNAVISFHEDRSVRLWTMTSL